MALSDYQPERVQVNFKGGSFSVKGLSLVELSALVRAHLKDLDAVFEIFAQQGKGEITADVAKKVAVTLAQDFPVLAAGIIAAGAEEMTDAGEKAAASMSFPLQIQTLVDIGRLTFEEAGGIKKSLESLTGLLSLAKVPAKGSTEKRLPH